MDHEELRSAQVSTAVRTPPAEGGGRPPVVGMIGAGQLARMTAAAAIGLGIRFRVLAAAPDESAAQVCADTVLGDYRVSPANGIQVGARPLVVQIRKGRPEAGAPLLPYPQWDERALIR